MNHHIVMLRNLLYVNYDTHAVSFPCFPFIIPIPCKIKDMKIHHMMVSAQAFPQVIEEEVSFMQGSSWGAISTAKTMLFLLFVHCLDNVTGTIFLSMQNLRIMEAFNRPLTFYKVKFILGITLHVQIKNRLQKYYLLSELFYTNSDEQEHKADKWWKLPKYMKAEFISLI